MSPLTRSLLALAALLAVADAEYKCATKTIGIVTDYPIELATIVVPYPGSWIDIDPADSNCPRPLHHVGETIIVCNESPYAPDPEIEDPKYGLTPVYVHCLDPSGCVARTTEYCG